MLAIDTETTGTDLFHDAKPFLVTLCWDDGEQHFYEWDVDPLTRQPIISLGDVRAIKDELAVVANWSLSPDEDIRERHCIVGHNIKFDVHALRTVGITSENPPWPWSNTHDTLLAAHVLGSNQKKDLTSLARDYLQHDMKPKEDALEQAIKAARRHAKRHLDDWSIASAENPRTPSIRKSSSNKSNRAWRYDFWLPRAIAKYYDFKKPESTCGHLWKDARHCEPDIGMECAKCKGHYWWVVLSEYANEDSAVTIALWQVMKAELRNRGYWPHYQERRKLLHIFTEIERRGSTVYQPNIRETTTRCKQERTEQVNVCEAVAESYGYKLEMPKAGMNKSLTHFCFGEVARNQDYQLQQVATVDSLMLPIVALTKKGNPSLDSKVAIPIYLATLERRSKQYVFIKALASVRKRSTALQYLANYRRFMLPFGGDNLPDWFLLHPNVNLTGSDTLRRTCNNPNLQNIAKQESKCPECHGEGCPDCNHTGIEFASLRRCFGPAPGREWWSRDYQNVELRIPAYKAGERKMIDLFEKPDEPPFFGSYHILNFSLIYPDLWADALAKYGDGAKDWITSPQGYKSTWYQWDKNFGFAKQYNCGRETGDRAAHRAGAWDAANAGLSEVARLNQRCIQFANKHGYIETEPDRTVDPRRGYPLLCTRTAKGGILPTVPLSYYVQGTAMWLTSRAMVRIQDFFDLINRGEKFEGRKWPGGYYFALPDIHDELVFDMPSGAGKNPYRPLSDEARSWRGEPWEYNLPIARECGRLMAMCGEDIGVPTPTGCEYHATSWAEGIKVKC